MRILCGALCLAVCASSCTDVGLYASEGRGPSAPDRAELEGLACVPLATGEAFPVRVLFAVPGGDGVSREVVGQVTSALDSLNTRFSFPYIRFSVVAYHSVATGLAGSFVDAAELSTAIAQYNAYNEVGPVSLRAPLRLAHSIVSGDMQTACRGQVARTRYLVVLLITSQDTSCANPAFNAGIDTRCDALDSAEACSACELTRVTGALKDLTRQYLAGEVVVQPIYVRTTPEAAISLQAAAIARAGGTQLIETDPAGIKAVLNGLNYASLQRELRLKRLIAVNRNALVRNGQVQVDSDGDGLSDDDEAIRGTDPLAPDTDLDGLGDAIEVRLGMNPQTLDVLNGCNPYLDEDGDRLNDCEERALGTDSCMSDSDGDSLPELVELLAGTNPLIAEGLADADRDGVPNVVEVTVHTDPNSADLAFRDERAYGYAVEDAPPTEDGRACYRIHVRNVGLVTPQRRPNPPYPDILEGMNDVYLYLQVGRDNDPRGTGIGSLRIEQLQYVPPEGRTPAGVIPVLPDEFVVGS